MKLERYLVVGLKNKWAKPSARLSVGSPSLKSNEIAIKLLAEIPDQLFSKPQLKANITVPERAVSAPEIEADVIDNIEEIINKELGVDLTISVIKDE